MSKYSAIKTTSFLLIISILLSFCAPFKFEINGAENEIGKAVENKNSLIDVIAGVTTINDVFGNLLEDSVPEIIGYDNAVTRNHIKRLYNEEKNDLNKVVFLNADGSKTVYLYDYPVKYVNESGQIKDITLEIADSTKRTTEFISANNSIVTSFPKKLSEGIGLDGNNVSISLVPKLPLIKSSDLSEVNKVESTAQRINNKCVSYVYDDNTSIEYSLTYTGFKEDIVVNEYTGQTRYDFTLFTNGLELKKIDGVFCLIDDDQKVRATIGDIWVVTADENNNTQGDLIMKTINRKQEYLLTIILDPEYLSSSDTKYPIRIDPSVEINYDNYGEGAISDITINSNAGSGGTNKTISVGLRETYGIARILMKFPNLHLSDMGNNIEILNATVELRDLMCESVPLEVFCYVFSGNIWNEDSANWSNVNPDSISTFLSSNTISYSIGTGLQQRHRYGFDITEAVKGWMVGNYNQDKGIIFKASSSDENGETYNSKTFASYNRSTNKPSLSITYTEITDPPLISDDEYYLNNMNCGQYLRYSSSISSMSGLISSLGDSIRWEIKKVDGGYVIRSKADKTKYLCVTSNTSGFSTSMETIVDSAIPTRAIWTITLANRGGCLIKNNYNSKYLYTYGSGVYTNSSTGTVGTLTYYSRTWRIASTSYLGVDSSYEKTELKSSYTIDDMRVDVGQTAQPMINTYASNAIWATYSEFNYVYQSSPGFSVNATTKTFTGITRGPEVIVTATHRVTNQSTSFKVTVNGTMVGLIRNLRMLYDVAYSYHNQSEDKALEAVFNFIRGQKYNDAMWQGIAGEWDQDFVNHIQVNYPTLYDYFMCDSDKINNEDYIITLLDETTSENIDIIHMCATLNRHFYSGSTSYEGIPTFGILEEEVDDLSGWAGDFQALIRDYFNDGNSQNTYTAVYNAFYPMIGDPQYYCSHSDIISDIDACNLAEIFKSNTIESGNQFATLISNYYYGSSGNVAAKRFTYWIGSLTEEQLSDKISPYCNDHSPYVVKWPILNEFSIYDYQQNAFTDAFVNYLMLQKQEE